MLASIPLLSQSQVLEEYIKKGIEGNLALRHKNFDLQKAQYDLKRAQSLFYPQASFQTQYTLASGGRSQELPIGDLLNGVYSTLNQLTSSNKFPQISNESIAFLPNDFHDTRVEVALPIINTDIRYNRQIKQQVIETQQADIMIYKRQLVYSIKQAYFRLIQASRAQEIYDNAMNLVKENLRVSEKFVQNNTATKEIVLRAKAQVSQVQSLLIQANSDRANAEAYLNFLLNQPLQTPIIIDSSINDRLNTSIQPSFDIPIQREEFTKLNSARKTYETSLRMNQAYVYPKLNAFYNIGFQGFGLKFNGDQFYQLGGLQLQWHLFKGRDNKYKIRQSQLDIEAIKNQYALAEQQVQLEVYSTYNDYRAAVQSLQSSADEVQSSRESYRLTERRFREGMAIQLEVIDMRTQLTNAEIRYSLAQLGVLLKSAELEKVTASFNF